MSIPRYSCIASAFTISPPTCSATASATADLPVPVGPTIAIGRVMAVCSSRKRSSRLPDADEVPDTVGRSPIELLGGPRPALADARHYLVGDPADDGIRQSRQRRGVTAGQRLVECGLHRDRVR